MTPIQRNIAVCCLAALTAAVAAAQRTADVDGSKDHPLVSRYPGLFISEYNFAEFDEFTLPLAKLKGDTPEKTQHLEGKITRIAYEGPAGRSILEIYRNYESALQKGGFQILFACANNAGCGSGNPTLYAAKGQDDWGWGAGQRYVSAKLAKPSGDVYVSLHIGQWSNLASGSAILLYVIEVKPMQGDLVSVDAAALAGDITKTGHSAVYGIYFDTGKADVKPESDNALKEIAKLLQGDAQLKLLVVGHTDNVGALASNMDLSVRRAAAVVQALTTKYQIPATQLNAQGAGPLAPVASNKSEEGRARNRRVELVEQ
jgi:outer membrane protein OmpA-like peptidoglycan-associated protein